MRWHVGLFGSVLHTKVLPSLGSKLRADANMFGMISPAVLCLTSVRASGGAEGWGGVAR